MLKHDKQLYFLNETIRIARNSDIYKLKLRNYPLKLKNISELKNLPFTTKKELRNCYPFGALSVPIKDVIEVHTSSGTTGKSTLSYFTQEDLKIGSREISRAWDCFGINNESTVQFMMSYGLFSGAALNTYAIQKLGGLVIPAGIQSAEKQLQMMIDFRVSTIVGTPGYYYYLFDYITENNISLKKFFLKQGIMAGEIYSDKVRADIESKFNIKIFDHYGLCEINTGIAHECEFRTGLHILDEYVFPEIINPETGKVLPDDSEGELILTTLRKKASPLIRYRTGDITSIKSGQCPCGRNSIRIDRIKRRVDDIIFIKGIKIDPYELKEYILESVGNDIYSDIKIILRSDFKNYRPKILVSLKVPANIKMLALIQKIIKNKTLITFDVEHIHRDYFDRGENNKIKFVEYVDKK